MKKIKYTTSFSSNIFASKEIPAFKKIEKESLASLRDLAPAYWESKNMDLLAVAFDAAVVNQFNANDDGIASSVAIQSVDKFRHKPINIEHDRSMIVGHITDTAFTDRSSHDIIWGEDAEAVSHPYNISMGGFIYKMVNAEFTQDLIESMDPTSPTYGSISASWEVGFNSFAIALGSNEVQHAEIISNPIEVAKYAEYLRAFGGEGVTEDGRRVYRLIIGDIYPLGIGFVKNPAADVKGIHHYEKADCEENKPISSGKEGFIANKEPDISQSEKSNVKSLDSQKPMEELLKQLKEALASQDKVTEEVAANIAKQFAEKIKEADVEYRQKLAEKDEAIAQEKSERENLKEQVSSLQEELESTQNRVKDLEAEKHAEALATARDQRLEHLDSLYELNDDDRKVIIDDLKNIDVSSDEEFAAYAGKLEVLLRHKNKEALSEAAKKEEENKKMEEAKASKKEADEEAEASSAEEALDNAKASEDGAPLNNNGGEGEEQTLADRFSKAINKDTVKIEY